jgi:hypothetical protein
VDKGKGLLGDGVSDEKDLFAFVRRSARAAAACKLRHYSGTCEKRKKKECKEIVSNFYVPSACLNYDRIVGIAQQCCILTVQVKR